MDGASGDVHVGQRAADSDRGRRGQHLDGASGGYFGGLGHLIPRRGGIRLDRSHSCDERRRCIGFTSISGSDMDGAHRDGDGGWYYSEPRVCRCYMDGEQSCHGKRGGIGCIGLIRFGVDGQQRYRNTRRRHRFVSFGDQHLDCSASDVHGGRCATDGNARDGRIDVDSTRRQHIAGRYHRRARACDRDMDSASAFYRSRFDHREPCERGKYLVGARSLGCAGERYGNGCACNSYMGCPSALDNISSCGTAVRSGRVIQRAEIPRERRERPAVRDH